ncbi:hypothetical protein ACFQ9Z_02120 [Streptomyces sp. NPDC056580]|uniref:hypothetical protein n=1 Tax=Streptomyces sp. NPDC056580 TaxID=3345872 RepID=UPI003690BA92
MGHEIVLSGVSDSGNVLVTSHQAHFTRDAVGQIARTTVTDIEDYVAGRFGENVLVVPGTD